MTLLKFEIGTFYAHAQQKIFINAISSNSETKVHEKVLNRT